MARKEAAGFWKAVWVEHDPASLEAAAASVSYSQEQWRERKLHEGNRNRNRVERQAMLIRELKAGASGARRFDIVGELRDLGTNGLDDLLAYLDAPKAPDTTTRTRRGE